MKQQSLQNKAKNEKVKRAYFNWLKGAQGFSDLTIEAVEKALWKFEDFTKNADFAGFKKETGTMFKNWLAQNSNPKTGKGLALGTQYHILRHVRDFFTWLSGQAGYKSRINHFDVQYLKLDKKQSRIALVARRQEFPPVDYVIRLCDSISINNEVDLRDRALIAFTLLSGMRDHAIITLPIECFDPAKLTVYQSPAQGVQTKFSKTIITTLLKFNEKLLDHFLIWHKHLIKKRCFSNVNPLFPRTKLEQKEDDNLCFEGTSVEPIYWKSAQGMRAIFKERAKSAGLSYYSPHKFRHSAIAEAMKHCRSAEEIKAISQNFGHENIGTTLGSYAQLDDYRVESVISEINFDRSSTPVNLDNVSKEELLQALDRRLK